MEEKAKFSSKNSSELAKEKPRIWDYKNEAIRKAMNRYPKRVPQFKVTEGSIELWRQGKGCDYYAPRHGYHHGQGYIVIADLETHEIFLVPSWNEEDGKERVNKNGVHFTTIRTFTDRMGNKQAVKKKWLNVSRAKLGGNSGDAHVNAAGQLGLADRAGVQGLLVGLGIWKGKKYLISELRNRSYSQNHFAIQFREDFVDSCRLGGREETDAFTASAREKSLPAELTEAISKALIEQLPSEKETRYRAVLSRHIIEDFPTPFHTAASKGNLDKLKELLDAGMNINEFGRREMHSSHPIPKTALYVAIEHEQWDAAKYLIERGADVNLSILTPEEGTLGPLALAIEVRDAPIDIIKLLIAKGANVKEQETYQTLSLGDDNRDEPDIDRVYRVRPREGFFSYPLYGAVTTDRDDIVKLLRENGARLFDKPDVIEHAVTHGNDNIIRYLIEQEHILEQDEGFSSKEIAEQYSTDMDWDYLVKSNMVYTAKLAIHAWKKTGILTEEYIEKRLEVCRMWDRKDIIVLLDHALKEIRELRQPKLPAKPAEAKPKVALPAVSPYLAARAALKPIAAAPKPKSIAAPIGFQRPGGFPPKPPGVRPAHFAPPKLKPSALPKVASEPQKPAELGRVGKLRETFEHPKPKSPKHTPPKKKKA